MNKIELLRRKKISKTLKRRHRTGELASWNKGMKMPKDYCQKLSDYWKTHDKKGKFEKGRIPWNKGLKGYMTGKKNVNWKGGISPENVRIRGSIEMREWRKKVFERDKYTCQVCYKVGGKLIPHHLKKFSDYPKLRLNVNNGMTLCDFCHKVYTDYKNSKNPANSANS